MRRPALKTICALALLLASLGGASPLQAQDANVAIEHYRAGIAAMQKEDWVAWERSMRAAIAAAPEQPVLLRDLARALARQGKNDEAVAWLRRVAPMGVDLGVAGDEHFAALRDRGDFQAVVAEIAAAHTAMGEPEVAMRLDLDDFMPEGIAYDPGDDVFYLGSVRHGRIIRVSTTGQWEKFADPGDMPGVLGLRVDAQRRTLWALSAVMPGVVGFTDERNGNAAVHCFDLDGGGVTASSIQVSNADGEHNLNDLVVAADGTAYITESVLGAVYTLAPGEQRLVELVGEGEIRGPNGIALSEDGTILYVAQYAWGLVAVDLERRSWTSMPHPADTYPIGIDGLYLHNGALIAIQNYAGLQQVTRFALGGDGRSIVGARVLARHHPRFDDPTTGAFRGDDFYVIANSQLTRADTDGNVPPADTFDDTFILKLTVK
jgi:sugar lactone lactonase YvrE